MGGAEGAKKAREASMPDRGVLLLLSWPVGNRGAVGGAGRGPLVVHGRLCGGDDRQGADADPGPHHLDRQHAYGGPARCAGSAGVRLPGALLPSWRVRALEAAQRRWFGEPGHRDRFILHGPLLADDGAEWMGSALLVQLGDRAAVEAMLAGAPDVQAGLYASVEIHDWQFGGRHQD